MRVHECGYCTQPYATEREADQCMTWHIEGLPDDLRDLVKQKRIGLADAWKRADAQ